MHEQDERYFLDLIMSNYFLIHIDITPGNKKMLKILSYFLKSLSELFTFRVPSCPEQNDSKSVDMSILQTLQLLHACQFYKSLGTSWEQGRGRVFLLFVGIGWCSSPSSRTARL